MSVAEDALSYLETMIKGAVSGKVRRADGTTATPPLGGALVTQEDGAIEATVILSCPSYAIVHSIPVLIEAYAKSDREDAIDAIVSAIIADRTLGGLIEWCDVTGCERDATETTGKNNVPMPKLFAASLDITATYTASPTG